MRTLRVVFGMLLLAVAATAADGTVTKVLVDSPHKVGVVKVEPITTDAVPQHMNVQGYITDNSGIPINGTQTTRFDIYRGGGSVWDETQEVDVENGLFTVILGSVTPIPYSVFEPGTTCELELTVEGQTLSPRVEITSVGHAYRSVKSDTAVYALASAGGDNAWVRSGSDSVLYTINRLGIAKGGASNKLYGTQAFTHLNLGVACTTGTSVSNVSYATVSGGYDNRAPASFSTVGGGSGNAASGSSATVAGGASNCASGINAAVGGGMTDSATGDGSVVAGGVQGRATGGHSAVGGGLSNLASGDYSVVAGGSHCVAGGTFSGVLGGQYDTVMGNYSAAFGKASYIFAADTAVVLFDSTTHGVLRINRDGRNNNGQFYTQPIYVGSSTHNGNMANLTAAGVWTDGSFNERSFKSAPVDAAQLLQKVKSLAVKRLTVDGSGEVHITPTADDFHAAFKCGTARTDNTDEGSGGGIAALDVAGVSLAAVQELLRQLEAQQAKIADLEARLAQLEK